MATFIVPSELRSKSNLKKYIRGMDYKLLPGLEALTGADVMISPNGMPTPRNDKMILSHIRGGAKLIQIKFGHDLASSIVDGRLEESLSRMLATGAMPWQCLLLYVGLIGCDSASGKITINGQLTYGKTPMNWTWVRSNLDYWVSRGGSFIFPLPSGNLILREFELQQRHVNYFVEDNDVLVWPSLPAFYDEIESKNPHLRKWKVAQKLKLVKDIRVLFRAIPDANIGPERATIIFDYMKDNGIHQSFMGFLSIVRDESILDIPGIGKGTLKAIRWGLFRTLEEREEHDSKKKRKT